MANKRNNPIWVMSSAFDALELPELIEVTRSIGAQGIDLCVFRVENIAELIEKFRLHSGA